MTDRPQKSYRMKDTTHNALEVFAIKLGFTYKGKASVGRMFDCVVDALASQEVEQ